MKFCDRLKGLSSILCSKSRQYTHPLPEILSPLLQSLLASSPFTHVLSSTSSAAKSLLPRVSALMDLPTLSDITSLSHDPTTGATTFTRPIYAGNAISTVRAPGEVKIKFCTVRGTAFAPATLSEGESDGVDVKEIESIEVSDPPTEHLRAIMTQSTRPDLSVAQRVVSGGRALKNAETFESVILPLADALNAAVGASRAAVDAGYVDNSLQVGQTGKVVAPELYVAVGISGAIQHLAGMKDSKMIVAINKVNCDYFLTGVLIAYSYSLKDPDAPIFQVADAGLVADLFDVVPELTRKLQKT
jgi:electron transfer flavoprotein alpha subunit